MLLLRNAGQLICTFNSVKLSYWWLSLHCKCFEIMFQNNICHLGRYRAYLLDNRTVHFHLSISKSALSYCNHANVNCVACIHVWTIHLFFYIKSGVVGRNSFEMCQNFITTISGSADGQDHFCSHDRKSSQFLNNDVFLDIFVSGL